MKMIRPFEAKIERFLNQKSQRYMYQKKNQDQVFSNLGIFSYLYFLDYLFNALQNLTITSIFIT